MAKENKPKVIKVIGKLMILRTGLTNEFKNPIAKATQSATVNPSTVIPLRYLGMTMTTMAITIYRMMNPIILFLMSLL